MTVLQFLETLTNTDMLRIVKGGQDVFMGYLAFFMQDAEKIRDIGGQQVQSFRAVPEIRHRQWKELNLMRPLRPEETPDFNFRDLQMKLYYTIYL